MVWGHLVGTWLQADAGGRGLICDVGGRGGNTNAAGGGSVGNGPVGGTTVTAGAAQPSGADGGDVPDSAARRSF
jgi:hypothetical protein